MALALKNQSETQQNNCLNLSKTTIQNDESIYEYTNTTATLTPTRLKSIEEQFFDRSLVQQPPTQFVHEHMAGFRIPSQVNIQSMIKSFSHFLVDKPQSTSQLQSTLAHAQAQSLVSSQLQPSISHINGNIPSTGQPLALTGLPNLVPPVPFYNLPSSSISSSVAAAAAALSSLRANSCDISENSNSSTLSQMATEPAGGNDYPSPSKKSKKNDRRNSKNAIERTDSVNRAPVKRSHGGGRKPKNDHVSPEEDMKRQKRRERNKIAAARCRKKRVDQTNDLEGQRNDMVLEHQNLCEKMREIMAQYCTQEARFNKHINDGCKNVAALQNNLPLLSQVDYDEIVNNMLPIAQRDEPNDEDGSGIESGNNSNHNYNTDTKINNYQITRTTISVPVTTGTDPNSPTTYKQIPLTTVIIPPTSQAGSANAKPRAIPVISTALAEQQQQPNIVQQATILAVAPVATTIPSAIGQQPTPITQAQSKRPNSLSLVPSKSSSVASSASGSAATSNDSDGIKKEASSALQTPSAGFFDNLDGSGTGLTPLAYPNNLGTLHFLQNMTTPLTDTPEGKTFTSM